MTESEKVLEKIDGLARASRGNIYIKGTMAEAATLIRRLQAESDTKDALRMQGEAQVASLLVEIARLKQLVDFADALRAAQRAYMADRGNDQLGRAVANAAKSYDDLRSLGGVRSDE